MPKIIKLVVLNIDLNATAPTLPRDLSKFIRQVYQSGLQFVIQTPNAAAIENTMRLLALENLTTVKIYSEPLEAILLSEKVTADETTVTTTVNFDIMNKVYSPLPANIVRGVYPSLFGLVDGKAVQYNPDTKSYIELDKPNADGNLRKICDYESNLAQLIINNPPYWKDAYHKINALFLADFDLKSDPVRTNDFQTYLEKVKATLLKEKLMTDGQTVREALVNLFSEHFDLTNVSQFYYNIWLANYGHEQLEQFVFLTNLLSPTCDNNAPIRLLQLYPNIAGNVEDRQKAYALTQPFLTCGNPQQRGRQSRPNGRPALTWGIGREEDNTAKNMESTGHYAAKSFFMPQRLHPVAQQLEDIGGAIIGGPSGTLGRSILMLAPLVQRGLLSDVQLKEYVMGFTADLIHRGHHSYKEIEMVANLIIAPSHPALDPVRNPIPYYEQLLTAELLESDCYKRFNMEHIDLFETPLDGSKPRLQ